MPTEGLKKRINKQVTQKDLITPPNFHANTVYKVYSIIFLLTFLNASLSVQLPTTLAEQKGVDSPLSFQIMPINKLSIQICIVEKEPEPDLKQLQTHGFSLFILNLAITFSY